MKSIFTNVTVEGISFPFVLRKTNGSDNDEKMTFANLTVMAKVDKIYKDEVKKEVLNIVSACIPDPGLNKLFTMLLKYINSIHAVKAEIICTYPYFTFSKSERTDKGYLKKYNCTLSLKKQSLLKYKKLFSIEVPALRKNYSIPGRVSKAADILTNLLVEIEGFETFYTEEIADVIEKFTDCKVENYSSRLIENIKKEFSSKYSFDKCTVKLIDRKIYKTQMPVPNSPVLHSENNLRNFQLNIFRGGDMKKRNIYITDIDKNKLKGLFSSTIGFRSRDIKTVKELLQEIERAEVIPENGQTLDVVTMNSTVLVSDLDLQKEYKYTIVYPDEADTSENRISILAPVGTALLGYKRGDVVEWEVPAGKRRLKIMEVSPRINSMNVSLA